MLILPAHSLVVNRREQENWRYGGSRVASKLVWCPRNSPRNSPSRDVVTGEWTHVAVTRTESSRQVRLLVNGAIDATGDHTGDRNIGACALIVIGANTLDSRYFQGAIDEVRAYNRVLSQSEIAALMRGNLSLAWDPQPATGGVVDVTYDKPLGWFSRRQGGRA